MSDLASDTPADLAERLDRVRRMGRIAGMLVKARSADGQESNAPRWVRTCLRQLGESLGQGAGVAMDGLHAPNARSVGMALGVMGTLLALIRSPADRIAGDLKAAMDAYFSAYFTECLGPVPPPPNIGEVFAQLIVGTFINSPYDDRVEFLEGVRIGCEIERSIRAGETRETTATQVYLELLLYWPEIAQMRSLSQVHEFLKSRFKTTPDQLGEFERFRKLANRIELSFRVE